MTSQHKQRGGSVWSGRAPEEDDEEGPWILVLGRARFAADPTIPGINSADDFATAASTAQSAGGK